MAKAVRLRTRSCRHTFSGAGGLWHSFELGMIGRDQAYSKEVGSRMAEGAGAVGRQSRGRAMPEGRRLTAPSSISGIRASGLGRLCARVRVAPPFYLQVLVPISIYLDFARPIQC